MHDMGKTSLRDGKGASAIHTPKTQIHAQCLCCIKNKAVQCRMAHAQLRIAAPSHWQAPSQQIEAECEVSQTLHASRQRRLKPIVA